MTGDERRVIDILVGCGTVKNVWDEPIHKVEREMHWDNKQTTDFVKNLVSRGLIHHEWSVVDKLQFDPPGECWKEGKPS
jgi:hypothetical protein